MQSQKKFTIEETGITLTQALKFMGVAESGGQGKAFISEGRVRVNGEVEFRKRRQMVAGDVVEVNLDSL
jgi:ribosome-associated protein